MLNVFNHTPTYVLYRGSVCPIASTIFTVCKTEAWDATEQAEHVRGQLICKTQSGFIESLICG